MAKYQRSIRLPRAGRAVRDYESNNPTCQCTLPTEAGSPSSCTPSTRYQYHANESCCPYSYASCQNSYASRANPCAITRMPHRVTTPKRRIGEELNRACIPYALTARSLSFFFCSAFCCGPSLFRRKVPRTQYHMWLARRRDSLPPPFSSCILDSFNPTFLTHNNFCANVDICYSSAYVMCYSCL